MKCPNPDRLFQYQKSASPDPELEGHLEGCLDCRTDLFIIRELPTTVRPQVEVPEWLMDRVMAELPPEGTSSDCLENSPIPPLVGGILGVVTALAALIASGTLSLLGGPVKPLLLSLVVGACAVFIQARGRREARS